jgi:putative protease
MVELLAPAGNMAKLKTAVHFGADAVYLGGKQFSLRAFSDNFAQEEIKEALGFLHRQGKKGYVTVNIFSKNDDFEQIREYLQFLQNVGADAVIVSDPGVIALCREVAPALPVHLSTQANTLNKYSARFWADAGVKRIVLARELSLEEIRQIREFLGEGTELEVFVHGAMCISYSGRCLLSNYLNGRDSNRGECVQVCRWRFDIREHGAEGDWLTMEEDARGTYILNSKDLNLIRHLKELIDAGANSFKIEGRMKSEYYVAAVVNSYRRALDGALSGKPFDERLYDELKKAAHRNFTTGYLFGANEDTVNLKSSAPTSEYDFAAVVLGYDERRGIKAMQRNRFFAGDELEVLSPDQNFNKVIKVEYMEDEEGNPATDAKLVQQILYIRSDIRLREYDMLRRKRAK